MFRNLNTDDKHNNRTIERLNRNYSKHNRKNQSEIEKEENINFNNQRIFHRIRRKSTSPTVELSSSFDCLERTDLFQHNFHDKQLIDWINKKLQSLGVDPVYNTSLIISLLNKSIQDYLDFNPNDSSSELSREEQYSLQSNSQRNRLTSTSVYQLCNSREKLFVNDRKSVNNHQAASSTTKFMHKRYQDCVNFQSKHYEEEFSGDFDQKSNSKEVSEKLHHYLKDATAQNSTAIESFVNELLERFERAASGVATQHHSEWMLTKDMDQKRRPIGNNEFSTKSTQSNSLSASVASNSTLNNNCEDRDFWHRNVNRNFRSNNRDNSETGVKHNDAHKYFNAFPALSDERDQSQGQVQQNAVHSVQNRSSKSNQWNGMKIIKNVADPTPPLNHNDNSNFTTLSSKASSSFVGKQRILVTPASNKVDKILDNNNMVTLKKIAAGKKSGISNSPSRNESNMSNSKHPLDVTTKKKITKEDEKILSVMPNFMNPLKKNETNSGTSNENSNSELLKGKDNKSSSLSDRRNVDNNQDGSQSSNGSLRNFSTQEMNQKQREFFENKFIKRSNSFGTRESKKYGFGDESKKNISGTSSKNSTNSQASSDDIDSDWRSQKAAVQNKNPLSVSNALVGIMPSYLKSVATADAQKVKKIEQKVDNSKNIKNSSITIQPESNYEVGASTIKSLTTMSSEEISKYWNEDSNMKFVPMLHESLFEDDAVFRNFLDLDKERKEDMSRFKSFKIDLKPLDAGEYFLENDNKFAMDDLMKEIHNLSLKLNNEKNSETTENRVIHVPYSKRKKYENGGAETFGRCPLSLAAIEAEHERLKNTATFEYFDFSTSSNEDLSISYMFERENDFESQFILEECYEEEHHYNIQCDEDNEAEFYANDYENFLAENEKANAEAERIGFNEFVTGNRHIDNTIDSVQKSQKPCKYLLEGFCARSDCKFSHNFKDITCRYWLEGYCNREHDCPFKHSLDDNTQMSHYQSRDVNNESYDFDIDGDFPALARNNVQHSQSSTELIGSPYYNNHNHLQNGKNFEVTEEWPTLDINGTSQSRLYPPTSTSNPNPSTMDSFGIEFKVAKKKNRKDKSKFKN